MEVYGTKPKKFTKEWWGYFWDYYKWHTAAVVFLLIVIAYSCVECATQVKYDLQADYISETPILEAQETALTELIQANIDDINANDKVEALVLALNMVETQDVQMMQALQTKMMLEMGYSEGYVFLLSKTYADMFSEAEALEACSSWLGDNKEGNYVSLSGCRALEEIGIDTSDLYLAVRKLRDDELDKEDLLAKYQNGIKLAQYLAQ